SLRTSYPPGRIEMLESEAAQGDGVAVGSEGEMIAAAAGGKWESRGLVSGYRCRVSFTGKAFHQGCVVRNGL
ncbi:MAG TPA: hypothetical protein VG322_08935, partial [Candidatus Acidoferrales bacterium]|nr:hypothetical protein [Candidatus Acidoferrales bacterium]